MPVVQPAAELDSMPIHAAPPFVDYPGDVVSAEVLDECFSALDFHYNTTRTDGKLAGLVFVPNPLNRSLPSIIRKRAPASLSILYH